MPSFLSFRDAGSDSNVDEETHPILERPRSFGIVTFLRSSAVFASFLVVFGSALVGVATLTGTMTTKTTGLGGDWTTEMETKPSFLERVIFGGSASSRAKKDDGAVLAEGTVEMIKAVQGVSKLKDPLMDVVESDFPNVWSFPSVSPNWERRRKWHHSPVPSATAEKGKFVMCTQGEWDPLYTSNFNSLFKEGMCIKEVRKNIKDGDFTGCDVRLFSQFAYLFNNGFKEGNQTPRSENNYFNPPEKLHENVVDFYYAHESPDHYAFELRGDTEYSKRSLENMQYLAWFNGDPSSPYRSSVWYPFGPTLGALLRDYPLQKKSRERRIPVVAWMSKNCILRERINLLVKLSKQFPVFSMGRCEKNIEPPGTDPGRLGDVAAQQELKSNYMFYFALENGIQCPHYITEKIYDALTRGSIPIYVGWDGYEEYLPDKNAIIDLRDFKSMNSLVTKLKKIASDDSEYDKYHAWRERDPSEWPLKFRQLVRQVSSDLKFGVCSTLKEGPSRHPPVDSTKQPTDHCDRGPRVLGKPATSYPGRDALWWEILGWNAENANEAYQVEMEDPKQLLTQNCEEHVAKCWELNVPRGDKKTQKLLENPTVDKEEILELRKVLKKLKKTNEMLERKEKIPRRRKRRAKRRADDRDVEEEA